jgi:23S rRNA pseudouridine1911/1915/1917 synthase
MVITYTASEQDGGRKVYSVLRRELRISETLTRRLKQAGAITVGGQPVFTDRILRAGETLEVDITQAEPPCDNVPERGDLEVLYEDSGLLAVNKPAGLLTHPSRARHTGTLSNIAAGYLQETAGSAVCHAVNRLDRDTSGVVLLAKSCYMKALASEALLRPEAEKVYLALVYGVPEAPSGTIDMPIRRLREGDMLRVPAPDGQRAVTHYETAGTVRCDGVDVTLLRLRLETGRTHQIRVHCLAMDHPVMGDILYYTDASKEASARLGIATQALHALSLQFTEPLTGKRVMIKAPPPEAIRRFM